MVVKFVYWENKKNDEKDKLTKWWPIGGIFGNLKALIKYQIAWFLETNTLLYLITL